MAELVLNTEEGRDLGSRSTRRLRREGGSQASYMDWGRNRCLLAWTMQICAAP